MASILAEETRQHAVADGKSVPWYRCPIDRKLMQKLHERNDLLGLAQSLGHLALLVATGALAWHSALHWHWLATVGLVYLHGSCYTFLVNGVHELGHGTVFRRKWLSAFFTHVYAFLDLMNHEMFQASHARHHRYTLHAPDDLEVILPIKLRWRDWLMLGLANPLAVYHVLKGHLRIARGKFEGEWELRCFPPDQPEKRKPAIRWARCLLLGHALILAVSIYKGWWMLPLLTTLAPFYGGYVQFLLNCVQHAGLSDNVSDFRLCCRTIYVNPVLGFLYWQMHYHTEHHMYAAVPFYNLGKLHRAIKHDMPPCHNGLFATWREVRAIFKRQREEPTYQYVPPLPVQTAQN